MGVKNEPAEWGLDFIGSRGTRRKKPEGRFGFWRGKKVGIESFE